MPLPLGGALLTGSLALHCCFLLGSGFRRSLV
jgi:hypothetical protein